MSYGFPWHQISNRSNRSLEIYLDACHTFVCDMWIFFWLLLHTKFTHPIIVIKNLDQMWYFHLSRASLFGNQIQYTHKLRIWSIYQLHLFHASDLYRIGSHLYTIFIAIVYTRAARRQLMSTKISFIQWRQRHAYTHSHICICTRSSLSNKKGG